MTTTTNPLTGLRTCTTPVENGRRRDYRPNWRSNCASTLYTGRRPNVSDGTENTTRVPLGINLNGPDGSPLIVAQCCGPYSVNFRIAPSLRWRLTESTPQPIPPSWASLTLRSWADGR